MPDDAIYARKVAAQFGVDLHEIEISPDIVDLLPRMVDFLDEPIGDPAAINTVLMCQAARERGVKVILSGMGADELFGGYRKHLACLMASRYHRLPGPVRGAARLAVNSLPVSVGDRGLRYPRWAKRFMTFAELPEEARFRRSYTLYDADGLAGLVGPELGRQVDSVIDEHAAIYNDNALDDEVNRMCLADARLFMAGLNLTYTDRASMAASVEVRVPFVDKVVAQAAFTIPGREKIRGRVQKAVLKDAAENWLPREIVHRPKASFGAPLRAWVRNDLKELIGDALVGGELVQAGMLRKQALLGLIADEQAGREDYAKQIWQLLSMELWYRQMRAAGVAS
jgi:asparagine synthase (glutamine-hydrolysing)